MRPKRAFELGGGGLFVVKNGAEWADEFLGHLLESQGGLLGLVCYVSNCSIYGSLSCRPVSSASQILRIARVLARDRYIHEIWPVHKLRATVGQYELVFK